MPSGPESLVTRFADPWESTEAPTAASGFTALITQWRTRSHTSTDCERSPRKRSGDSLPERKSLSWIPRRVRRGSLQRYEKLGTDDRNSAFWSTSGRYGRLAGTISRAVHLARTVATTGAATTCPSLLKTPAFTNA